MTRLVVAHLLIPVIFKALNSEGLGHLLQCPFTVLHPVKTIEVICLLLCAHSDLTGPSGTGARAGKLGTPRILQSSQGPLQSQLFDQGRLPPAPAPHLFLEENKLGCLKVCEVKRANRFLSELL